MDNSKSLAGYTSIKKLVILAQTDTTVGFLSLDADTLYEIKERSTKKQFINLEKIMPLFL